MLLDKRCFVSRHFIVNEVAEALETTRARHVSPPSVSRRRGRRQDGRERERDATLRFPLRHPRLRLFRDTTSRSIRAALLPPAIQPAARRPLPERARAPILRSPGRRSTLDPQFPPPRRR